MTLELQMLPLFRFSRELANDGQLPIVLLNICIPIHLQIPAFAGYKISGLLRGAFSSGGLEV